MEESRGDAAALVEVELGLVLEDLDSFHDLTTVGVVFSADDLSYKAL